MYNMNVTDVSGRTCGGWISKDMGRVIFTGTATWLLFLPTTTTTTTHPSVRL